MPNTEDDTTFISRRDLLKRVTIAGAAAVLPLRLIGADGQPMPLPGAALQGGGAAAREALETLTAVEAETLDAVVARLIPADASGPGALQARAARYIDRALGGALSSFRESYRAGLADLDRYARTAKGQGFAQLPAADQDAVLTAVEAGAASGFAESAGFFNIVLSHTAQGTFGDPFYGGNADFAGWDLIGYPGVRLAVTAEEQRIDARPSPTHRSAYDHAMFSKKRPARAALATGDHDHAG
jgi:gluconate 2-dehydrogenase gamma chain